MISVYFDWNVISQMKNGFLTELASSVLGNEKLLTPYSTSHIGDILSSHKETIEQKEIICSDLEYLGNLTQNKCLLLNSNGDVVYNIFPPKELYNQKLEHKEIFSDLSLQGISKILKENEPFEGAEKIITKLFRTHPINEYLKQMFEDPQNEKLFDLHFPGLKENPTLEGFFASSNIVYNGLYEKEDYKELRKSFQLALGINRDKIFNSESPYEIIESVTKKLNINEFSLLKESKHAPKWFNAILEEYQQLDMFGYQEDKVNTKKGRKETLRNTQEDAFHCAFASTCDIYILNDHKSYKKTKQVYNKLKINTKVLKPFEFLNIHRLADN